MSSYKGLISRSKHVSTYFVIVRLSILLVFIVPFITFTEQALQQEVDQRTASSQSVVVNRNSKPKLKICTENKIFDSFNGTVNISTFSPYEIAFVLEEYEINEDKYLESCPNGEKLSLLSVTVEPKDNYGKLNDTSGLLQMLRSEQTFFDNGYLSVGNAFEKTAKYFSPAEFCIEAVHGNGSIDFRTCSFAKARPKFRKCCPMGMLLGERQCIGRPPNETWDPGYMDAKTWKILPIGKVDPVYTFSKLSCAQDSRETWEADDCLLEFHPVTDNTIAFIGSYRSWEFFDSNLEWCMDTLKSTDDGTEITFMIRCIEDETSQETEGEIKEKSKVSSIYMISMYTGASFHLLTTVVYLITWKKQNIHGKTLCSCTVSLFFMQFFLGTAHLLGLIKYPRKSTICFGNSIGGQYFMIAAFTWLLVVNYDLWKTFRSIRTEGGKNSKRFRVYSATGWLFPLIVSAISISLDLTFTCRTSRVLVPDFGKYYCFVAPWAQGVYIYYIIGVLIAFSFILAVLTLISLYKAKKEAVNLRSNKRAEDQQSVFLFLKLSVVMGFTWIFEVISWAATIESGNHVGWIILDLYNALSAILIFLIFVCKKTTLNMLEQTVPIFKGITSALSKFMSTFSGDSSTDSTNTTSTIVSGGGPGHKSHDKVLDVQTAVKVHYTKEQNDSSGNVNMAFEQSGSK